MKGLASMARRSNCSDRVACDLIEALRNNMGIGMRRAVVQHKCLLIGIPRCACRGDNMKWPLSGRSVDNKRLCRFMRDRRFV